MLLKIIVVTSLFLVNSMLCIGQITIDGKADFQTENNKAFSLYIPSTYDAAIPNKLIVGFHPFNTARWNSTSWRDTLIAFAESVDAILLCPDGGADGKVDDAIDTAFTSFLMDSIQVDYNIEKENIYNIGFSWGARTCYTYGLFRPELFAGNLIIGAAINGTEQVANTIENSGDQQYYIIHGSQDNLSVRFTPILDALNDNGACVESMILSNVGHTIDFTDRNAILKNGFLWLEENNCLSNTKSVESTSISIYPNPSDGIIIVDLSMRIDQVYDVYGKTVAYEKNGNQVELLNVNSGMYLIKLEDSRVIKILVSK